MTRYVFTLTISVDQWALDVHNDAEGAFQLNEDATEWNADNLALAIGDEVAVIENIDAVVRE